MTDKYTFQDLVGIVDKLRAPGGCPWDIEQTHQSIKKGLVEESYELAEAIDSGDGAKMAEESGDLLLQIVFHAGIGRDAGEYTLDDVTDSICRKMIQRHPHVFGTAVASTADEVLTNWDAIKRDERGQASTTEEMRGISTYLPALVRADKVIKKAKKHGYKFEAHAMREGLMAELWKLIHLANRLGVDLELELANLILEFIDEVEKWEGMV